MLPSLLLLLQTAIVVPPAAPAHVREEPRDVAVRSPLPLAPRSAPPSNPGCRDMTGLIEARAEHIGLDWHGFRARGEGTISGDLDGAVRVEVRRRGKEGSVTDLSIRVDVVTSVGTYRLDGPATSVPAGDTVGGQTVEGWLDLVPERSPEAAGRVVVSGAADTRSRAIHVSYAGQICGQSAHGPDAAAQGDVR